MFLGRIHLEGLSTAIGRLACIETFLVGSMQEPSISFRVIDSNGKLMNLFEDKISGDLENAMQRARSSLQLVVLEDLERALGV